MWLFCVSSPDSRAQSLLVTLTFDYLANLHYTHRHIWENRIPGCSQPTRFHITVEGEVCNITIIIIIIIIIIININITSINIIIIIIIIIVIIIIIISITIIIPVVGTTRILPP